MRIIPVAPDTDFTVETLLAANSEAWDSFLPLGVLEHRRLDSGCKVQRDDRHTATRASQ